jgi:hypothetical protein
MKFNWHDGFALSAHADGDSATISGNRAGPRSLADHLVLLAEQHSGAHFHLDSFNGLDDGSIELVFELMPDADNEAP